MSWCADFKLFRVTQSGDRLGTRLEHAVGTATAGRCTTRLRTRRTALDHQEVPAVVPGVGRVGPLEEVDGGRGHLLQCRLVLHGLRAIELVRDMVRGEEPQHRVVEPVAAAAPQAKTSVFGRTAAEVQGKAVFLAPSPGPRLPQIVQRLVVPGVPAGRPRSPMRVDLRVRWKAWGGAAEGGCGCGGRRSEERGGGGSHWPFWRTNASIRFCGSRATVSATAAAGLTRGK